MISKSLHRAAVAAGVMILAALMTAPLGGVQPTMAAGATSQGVMCKDGTMSARGGRGACRGHGGIAKHPSSSGTAVTGTKEEASQSGKPGQMARREPPASAATLTSAPGEVWVNSGTRVYHCRGDRWYGKTKHGQYMSEADAKTHGYRPDHGKGCT